MAQLILDYPEHMAQAVALTPEEFAGQVRLMAALKMFELGKLSSAKAAELAGVSRRDFIEACSRYRISAFNYPDAEAAEELRADVEATKGSGA